MASAFWTLLTVLLLLVLFAAGAVAVVAGIRFLENVLARRRGKRHA
jgi:hypothetical protein